MPKQHSDIQLKKQAFRTSIRKQWLTEHFKQRRAEIIEGENRKEGGDLRTQEVIEKLPGSIMHLVDMMQDEEMRGAVMMGVVSSIKQIAEKMVRLEAVQWSNYLYILEKVLEGTFKVCDLQRVASHTFLSVLECGQLLARKNRQNPSIYCHILNHALDYLFRATIFLTSMDGLEQAALVSITKRLWHGHQYLQSYEKLLYICNNIVCREDGASPQQQHKIVMQFIYLVFYSEKAQVMKLMISKLIDHILRKDTTVNKLSLQLLVNITNGTFNPIFFYPLLEYNIIHVINTNLIYYKDDREVIMLTIRLLNNMVVNDTTITKQIFSQITFFCIINLFKAFEQEEAVQVDLVELFINLIHFMNEEADFIRQLVNKNVIQLILEFLTKVEDCDENLLNQALTSLMIALNYHPLIIRQSIRQYQDALKRLVGENSGMNKVGSELIKYIYEQGENKDNQIHV